VPNHGKTRIKPTALKKLHGTLNPTREKKRAAEPVPAGALPQTPPQELTSAERVVWRATVRNMPKGVLFRADTEVVKAFCRIATRVDELQRVLNGALGRPDWGSAIEHRNLDRALLLLARLAGELGLTPAARPRLQVVPPASPPELDDPWSLLRLVRGGKADPEPAY
jgi:phage terminase small subunit